MGGGASTGRQPLHALSADGVLELVEGIGPSYSDLAKQLHELGYDGEFLAKASEDDLTEIFDELEVPKLKQKLLRRKLDGLKVATPSTGGRTTNGASGTGAPQIPTSVRQIAPEDMVIESSEPIGRGGFAVVYRGTWNQRALFGRRARARKIAAKRSHVGLDAGIQIDLAKDLMVMSDCPHQNVLIVHGACHIPDVGFHVICELMAYDLDAVIHHDARGPLHHQDILHISRDVAAGLAHLHANRIVHRDLKPQNVLVADVHGLRCKIADFGISKELTDTLATMTANMGTYAYMAPETLEEDARIGTSADAYAYGVLVWELLGRKRPWADKSQPQIVAALLRGDRLPRPEAPLVPELADWAVDCFGMAAERPTMRALETKLDDLLCADEGDLERLRAGLAEALRGDKDAYEEAWDIYACDPHCGELLELCAILAKRHAATPRQPESCKAVEDLLGLAERGRDDFHDIIGDLVKTAGGEYRRGPTKLRERCIEKARREYDGEFRRVVDVERATALFTTVSALHEGLRQLSLLNGGDLEVVRVKDGFGEPKPSGWRCVYFSLVHVSSGLVGELQMTFTKVKAINGRSHRIYNLVRCLERGVEPAARTARAAEEMRRQRRAAAARAAEEEKERADAATAEAEEKRLAAEAKILAAEAKAAEAERKLRAAQDMAFMSLFDACKHGRTDVVQAWLDRGADANSPTDTEGRTPLYVACQNGHVDAARLLLEKGAEVDRADEDGWTPLYAACSKGHVDAARLLLEKGAAVDRAKEDGATPLWKACYEGQVDAARLLLEKGAEVDRADEDGWTPLYAACSKGHVDAARLLLEKGAEVDRAAEDGRTPLWTACGNGHVDAARLLLEKGAEVDRATNDGQTPLLFACFDGHVDAARLLLEKGAEVDRAMENGKTPLFAACQAGHVDAARLLLDKGAEVDRADKDGATPLAMACLKGHVDAARLVLEKGAEVNRAINNGATPLYAACEQGRIDAARLCLDRGAEVDRADEDGWTPLYAACYNGHVDAARLLLDNGAEVDRADEDGTTPLDIAKRQGHSSIVALLKAHRK